MSKKEEQRAKTAGDKTEQQNQHPAEPSDEKKEMEPDNGENPESVADPLDKLNDLEAKLEETNDRFLRLFSEFDNFRKRTARERIELTKTASADIITALLPVLDDLERACHMEGPDEGRGNAGVLLIYNKFKAILRQKGVEEVPAIGETFDTDLHEAITHVPASEKSQKGKIVEEIQKGYKLNEKVIRHSRVVVAN